MEKYKKMLSICGKVRTTKNYKKLVYNYIKENQDAVKEMKCLDIYGRFNPYNIFNYKNWNTCGDYSKFTFYIENETLFVNILIKDLEFDYNSDIFSIVDKWECVIELPMSFIENIKSDIEAQFYNYCNNEYEIYLDECREKWIAVFAKKILE